MPWRTHGAQQRQAAAVIGLIGEIVDVKPGTRLRCDTCGAELILVKAASPELSCCGKPLEPLTAGGPARS
jgi:hypothetical protein